MIFCQQFSIFDLKTTKIMGNPDHKGKKQKKFLEQPKYPGGSSAFKKFISDNLTYPEEALKNRIEGWVYIKYTVDNMGIVKDARVTKGLGFGCDEEAIRIVRLLKYNKAKNRGVRVSSKVRTKILFKINKNKAGYQVKYETNVKEKTKEKDQAKKKVYNYTINIG